MSETDAKVKEMAKLVVYSNKISEFHEKNLKMFPFVFFNGVKSVLIDYNLERIDDVSLDNLQNITINKPTSKNYVKFTLSIEENLNNLLPKRFAALEKAVRDIFWKNIKVEIVFNDRVVYKSGANG